MSVAAGSSSQQVHVRGGATAEELAAVIALVSQADRGAVQSRYDQWRAGRLKALRSATHHAQRPAHR